MPASRVLEVTERIGAGGVVLEPLDEASVQDAAEACRALEVEAVAVCLLHSFANPAHERRVAEILRAALPGVAVTASTRRAAGGARIRALAGDGAERGGDARRLDLVSRLEQRLDGGEASPRRCC